jgi:hypothetical protein
MFSMATRPVFTPRKNSRIGVNEVMIEFPWSPGMAKVQKQKSIKSLHEAAEELNIYPVLEISSKSEIELGIKLSAFNLMITTKKQGKTFSVETAFQSSKVFEKGGPFVDLLDKTSREAKKDIRLKESGNLVAFSFFGNEYSLQPKTFFYDWIYINALNQNNDLSDELMRYQGFTDIEFNPKKSINCQAYSAALYSSLRHAGLLSDALASPETFKEILETEYRDHDAELKVQGVLV